MKRNKEGGKNVRNGRGRTKAGWRSLHFDLQLFCNSLIPSEEPLELVGDSRSVTDVPGSSSIYLSIRCLNFRLQLGEWMHLKKPLVASPEHSWDYDCTYDAGQLERDHNNEKNNHNNKKRKRAKRRITGVGAAHKRPHCSSRRRSLPPYSHKCSSLLQSSLTWQSKHM